MLGKLKSFSVNTDGTQNLTVTLAEDFREEYENLKEHEVKIEIKKFARRRSLEANSYCWMLIDRIAEKTGIKKSEVYRNAIKEIGGVSTCIGMKTDAIPTFKNIWEKQGLGNQVDILPDSNRPGWSNVVVYFGSSSYDSKQMSRLIDSLVQDAESLGIPTVSDNEIERMLEMWGRRKT